MNTYCKDCGGACCEFFKLKLPKGTDKEWLGNHKHVVIEGDDAIFFLPCKYLDFFTKECSIYPNRPRSCKAFKVRGAECLEAQRVMRVREGENLE